MRIKLKSILLADSDLEISDRKLPANVIEEIESNEEITEKKDENEDEVDDQDDALEEMEFIEKPERNDIEKKLE